MFKNDEELKNCKDCKKEISVNAKKCCHCGSYQNWMRFFNQSLLVTGFILTWVSIWAASPIADLLDEKRADIRVSILEGDYSNIVFMMSNVGSRAAGLAQIEIESKSRTWYLHTKLDKKLIEPGKAYILKGHNEFGLPSFVSHEIRTYLSKRYSNLKFDNNCKLVIQYVQMNGVKEYMYYPFRCGIGDIKLGDSRIGKEKHNKEKSADQKDGG